MRSTEEFPSELTELVQGMKKIAKELQKMNDSLEKTKEADERKMILSQMKKLKENMRKNAKDIEEKIREINLIRPLKVEEEIPLIKDIENAKVENIKTKNIETKKSKLDVFSLDKEGIKRLRRENIEVKKIGKKVAEKKPSKYIAFSNKLFAKYSDSLLKKGNFEHFKMDLIKSNLQILPKSYVSVILFSTLISFIVSIFIFVLFLISGIGTISQLFWIIIVLPIITFVFAYLYPTMEKKSAEARIDQELPFAAIHMAAISGSMIDPTKLFNIVVATGEYPYLSREFIKLINEVNILGKDLVGALRNRASNSPSKKLTELFNGLATTITSGGNLQEFFEKRSQTLLFEYHLEREKYTKSAETFMDIYISVVIAAPMILMLIVMLMKISGFGISLSMNALTLIIVLGVFLINAVFLTFLQLKQPGR